MPILTHELASASPPNPLQPLAFLRACTALTPTTPQDHQYIPLILPPHVCPHPSLCFRNPTSPSPLLTILMLPQDPQDMPLTPPSTPFKPPPTLLILYATYHPYTHVVPSRHASNTAYHPYAHVVPSRYVYDTAYNFYAPARPQDKPPMVAPHLHAHPAA
ncbi:hypothetical protein O181_082886 [Austropuccinia psidii MF-1]|uniref:Uncharacterized protein n=1 Tax=Austropuccinia psidii MF-1 TaxID=1389203 RepID=A0A9Q3FTI8_9BASI|nr:hypothetical protein [Austropuccinia psidii MF-1]